MGLFAKISIFSVFSTHGGGPGRRTRKGGDARGPVVRDTEDKEKEKEKGPDPGKQFARKKGGG